MAPPLLPLLHPSGPTPAVVVLGGGCPPGLAPRSQSDSTVAELVLIAPDASQSRRKEWLVEAARNATRVVTENGLVLAWGGPALRLRARRLLARAGLRADATVFFGRRRGSLVAPPPALRIAASLLPGALVLRRPESPPPIAWLDDRAMAGFSLRVSPRTGDVVVQSLDRWGRKSVTAKVSTGAREEHAKLVAFAPDARRAGALMPDARLVELPGTYALVQQSLPGRAAARLLIGRRRRPEQIVVRLTAWLEEWGKLSRRTIAFGGSAVEREILDDLALLAPELDAGHVSSLRARCSALREVDVPVVAAHRDLTMWNVLIDGDRIAVIDWESATGEALPLVDFEYAVVDALAASHRYRDRVSAFTNASASWVGHLRENLARALEVPPAVRELASHACWLHHAANEQRRPESAGRPFLEIARSNAAA